MLIIVSEDTGILEFNQYQKSDKAPFSIYTDLAYIIKMIDGCKKLSWKSFYYKIRWIKSVFFNICNIA